MTQPIHDPNVFPMPKGDFSAPSPQGFSPDTIRTDYDQIRNEAFEAASSLAISAANGGTPIYDRLRQAHPEYQPTPEVLKQINLVTELTHQAREAAVEEKAAQLNGLVQSVANVLGAIGLPGGDLKAQVRQGLAEEEGIMAATLFKGVPSDEQWSIYPDGSSWFVKRAKRTNRLSGAEPYYSSVHYRQDPHYPYRMIKSEMRPDREELAYEIVSEGEMEDLLIYAKKYYQNVVTLPSQLNKKPKHRRPQ